MGWIKIEGVVKCLSFPSKEVIAREVLAERGVMGRQGVFAGVGGVDIG